LQIEINRALYMDERRFKKKPGFNRLASDMTALIAHLGQLMQDSLGELPRAAAE
jgi:N-formylglutamate deformylase